jgi:hypothetical protein
MRSGGGSKRLEFVVGAGISADANGAHGLILVRKATSVEALANTVGSVAGLDVPELRYGADWSGFAALPAGNTGNSSLVALAAIRRSRR